MSQVTWKYWTVAVAALLWNLVNAFDYYATQTASEAYLSQFTPEQLELFTGMPAWTVAAWAIAAWGGLLGAILLLLRKRWAVQVFAVSLAGMVVTAFHNFVLANGVEVVGAVGLILSIAVFAIAAALLWFSRRMQDRGILT